MTYSYCESVTASGYSFWCIRRLTDVGRKLGGGVDTPSLCGRVRKGYGWDLAHAINEAQDSVTCPKCLEEFQKVKEE